MARRTLLLVAAVLLAAIGTGVLFFYVRATSGTSATSGDSVAVLAPTTPIAAGTKITTPDLFQTVSVDRKAVQPGQYVTRFDQVQNKVATRDLPAFVAVSLQQFKGTVQRTTSLSIEPGKLALTVEIEDPNRVSSFLTGGENVALFVLAGGAAGAKDGSDATLLLPSIKVLTTGTSATILDDNGQAAGGTSARGAQALVTFEVNQDQAGRILVAEKSGEIYLALLGPETTVSPRTYGGACLQPTATC